MACSTATRAISNLELLLNGAQPLLLGSAIRDDNLSYHIDLTNADVYDSDRIVLLKDTCTSRAPST